MPHSNLKPQSGRTARLQPILPKVTLTPNIIKPPTTLKVPELDHRQAASVPHTDHVAKVTESPTNMQQQCKASRDPSLPFPTGIVHNRATSGIVHNRATSNRTAVVKLVSKPSILKRKPRPVAPKPCESTNQLIYFANSDSNYFNQSTTQNELKEKTMLPSTSFEPIYVTSDAQVDKVGVQINKIGDLMDKDKGSHCDSERCTSSGLNIKTEQADAYFDRVEKCASDAVKVPTFDNNNSEIRLSKDSETFSSRDQLQIVSDHASADNENEEILPIIKNFYSMQSLSLREMMERFQENNHLPSAYEAGSRMFLREQLLYQCMKNHNVSGIQTDVDPNFYLNLISEPYISVGDVLQLKREVAGVAAANSTESVQSETLLQKDISMDNSSSNEIHRTNVSHVQSSDVSQHEINAVSNRTVSEVNPSTEFPMERCRLCGKILPIVDIASHLKAHHSMENLNSLEYSQWLLENHKRLQIHLEKLKKQTSTEIQSVSCAAVNSYEYKAGRKRTVLDKAVDNHLETNSQESNSEADMIRKAFTIKKHLPDRFVAGKGVENVNGCEESIQSVDLFEKGPDIKTELDQNNELHTAKAVDHTHSSLNQLYQQKPECSNMMETRNQNTSSDLRGKLWNQECISLERMQVKQSNQKDLGSVVSLGHSKQKDGVIPIAPKEEFKLDVFDTGNVCYICYQKKPPKMSMWYHLLAEHVDWNKMNNKEPFNELLPNAQNPYYCSHCLKKGSRFSSMSELLKHEWTVHIHDSSCYFCGCTFLTYIDMINHVVKEHCSLSRCIYCHKDFCISQDHCSSCFHPLVKTLICPHCGVVPQNRDILMKHFTIAKYCKKEALKSGIKCFSCKKIFLSKTALEFHQGPNANILILAPKRRFTQVLSGEEGPGLACDLLYSRKAITVNKCVFIYSPDRMITGLNLQVCQFEDCHRIVKELVHQILNTGQQFALPYDLSEMTAQQRDTLKLFSRTTHFSKVLKEMGYAPLPLDIDVYRLKMQFEASGGKSDLFLPKFPVNPVGMFQNGVEVATAPKCSDKVPVTLKPGCEVSIASVSHVQSKHIESLQLFGKSTLKQTDVNHENLDRVVAINNQTSTSNVVNSSSLKDKSGSLPQRNLMNIGDYQAGNTVVINDQQSGSNAIVGNSLISPGPQSMLPGMPQNLGYFQQPVFVPVNQEHFPVCPQVMNPLAGFQMAHLPSAQLALVDQALQPNVSQQSKTPEVPRHLLNNKSIQPVTKRSDNKKKEIRKASHHARWVHGLGIRKNARSRICKKYRKRLVRRQCRPADEKTSSQKSTSFSNAFAKKLSNYKIIAPMPAMSVAPNAEPNSLNLLENKLEDARQKSEKLSSESQALTRQREKDTVSEITNTPLTKKKETASKFYRNSEKDYYVKPSVSDPLSVERNLRERKGVRRYVFDDSDSDTQADDTTENEGATELNESTNGSLHTSLTYRQRHIEEEENSEKVVKEPLMDENIDVGNSTDEKLDQESYLESRDIILSCIEKNGNNSCDQTPSDAKYHMHTMSEKCMKQEPATQDQTNFLYYNANRLEKHESSYSHGEKIPIPWLRRKMDQMDPQVLNQSVQITRENAAREKQRILQMSQEKLNEILDLQKNQIKDYDEDSTEKGLLDLDSETGGLFENVSGGTIDTANVMLLTSTDANRQQSENSDDDGSTKTPTLCSKTNRTKRKTKVTFTTHKRRHESVIYIDKCEVKDEMAREITESRNIRDGKIYSSFVKLERNDHAEKLAEGMKRIVLGEAKVSTRLASRQLQLNYETRFSSMCASRLIEAVPECGTKSSTNKLEASDSEQYVESDCSSAETCNDEYEMCSISESSPECSEVNRSYSNDRDWTPTDESDHDKQGSGMKMLKTKIGKSRFKGNQYRKMGTLNRTKTKIVDRKKVHKNFGHGEILNSSKKRKHASGHDYGSGTDHSKEFPSNDCTLKISRSRKRIKMEVDDTMQRFKLDGTEKSCAKGKSLSCLKCIGGYSKSKRFWQERKKRLKQFRNHPLFRNYSDSNTKGASSSGIGQSQIQHLKQGNASETATVSGRVESICSASALCMQGFDAGKLKDQVILKSFKSDETDVHDQNQIAHDEIAKLQEVGDPLTANIKQENSLELNMPFEGNISSTANVSIKQLIPNVVRDISFSPTSRAPNSALLNSPKSGVVNIVRYPIVLTPKPGGSASFLQAVMQQPQLICPTTRVSMPRQEGGCNPSMIQHSSSKSSSNLSMVQLSSIYSQSVSKICPNQAKSVTNTVASSSVSNKKSSNTNFPHYKIKLSRPPGTADSPPLNVQPATSIAMSSMSSTVTSATTKNVHCKNKVGRPYGSLGVKKRNLAPSPAVLPKTMPKLSLSSSVPIQQANMTINAAHQQQQFLSLSQSQTPLIFQQNQSLSNLAVNPQGVKLFPAQNQQPGILTSSQNQSIQHQSQPQTVLIHQNQQTVPQIQAVHLNGQTMPSIQLATSQQTVPQMILTQPQFAQTAVTQQVNHPVTQNVSQQLILPSATIKREPADLQSPAPQQVVVPSSFNQSFAPLQVLMQQPQTFVATQQQQLGTAIQHQQQLGTAIQQQQLGTAIQQQQQQLGTAMQQQQHQQQLGTAMQQQQHQQQLGTAIQQQQQQLGTAIQQQQLGTAMQQQQQLGTPMQFIAPTPQLGYVPGSFAPGGTILSAGGQTFIIQGSLPDSVITSKPAS